MNSKERMADMTQFKNLVTRGAIVALATLCSFAVFAKDDLDELLDDLEGPSVAEPAKKESPAAEEKAETPAPAAEEKAEAPAAEEKAEEPAAEEKPSEKKDGAESEERGEDAASTEPAEEPAEATAEAKAEEPAAPAKAEAEAATSDEELLADIGETEKLRRQAYDSQARREIEDARKCMEAEEYVEAARHYGLAAKLLNDRSASQEFRKECDQGIAEAIFQAAMQERDLGNRERSLKLMEKAADLRHPKAGKLRDKWKKEDDPNENRTTYGDIKHRRNDKDYVDLRKTNNKHLQRARQMLATREIDKALDECELVLVTDPYNQDAIRLRGAIQKKRALVLGQEFEVARDGMIADVDRAWRPVYAPNARQIAEVSSSTVTKALGEDPERALEQTIVKRMKEMRLPAISFKPPATIIDAVEFFRGASKDYDRPDIPLEQRGFNFVLKTPETLKAAGPVQDEGSDDFSATASEDGAPAGQAGVPVIPMITASDITFYDALKLVCESVEYKFKVQGPIVMVMQKDMSTDEMVTRSYPVVAAFLERMGSAASDMKEMKTAGFGGGGNAKKDEGEENQERDWKEFFSLMGVQWPEGSSILYIKTIGKLRVKNTYDNLAELEKALTELNVDQKLIEIEARFVEVGQEDLNSLGFEWILNSDYTIGMDNWLGKAMNIKEGMFEGSKIEKNVLTGYKTTTTTAGGTTTQVLEPQYVTSYAEQATKGADWIRDTTAGASRGIGVNAMGGSDSDYGNGNRYLSTKGNHISGADSMTNDQFMRVNAFIGNADLSMILHMLSQRSDTDLLSAPKVLTRPGEEAVMKVVTEYIYPTDYDVQLQSSSSGSSGGSSSGGGQSAILAVVEPQSFTMREVGVILDVTPTLTDDGNLIDLKINAQVVDEPYWKDYGMRVPFTGNASNASIDYTGVLQPAVDALDTVGASLSDTAKAIFAARIVDSATTSMENLSTASKSNMEWYKVPMEQPWFHVRSIDSNVSIYPGATIVMGGLITEERKAMDDKIPFLGDLPYIGRLFRSHAEQTKKRNLLIFVTTRLVDVRGREVSIASNTAPDTDKVKAAPDAAE